MLSIKTRIRNAKRELHEAVKNIAGGPTAPWSRREEKAFDKLDALYESERKAAKKKR
jgi:hypothetical protein